jgi:hypothetical protein
MHKLAFLAVPLFAVTTPATAADLGPYPERDSYYERPAPQVVERERIIERHYYEPAPVYERRVYAEPPVYDAPRVYADGYYGRPYAYTGWRPRHFYPRPYWHRGYRGW